MRNLLRGKQDIWFCTITEKVVGIDTVKVYSKPVKKQMSVSATSGTVTTWGAGYNIAYDRYITSYERDFSPTEGMGVFVDVEPTLDDDGNLKMATTSTGDPSYEYYTTPDYIVNKILDTQRGTVARYGIKKV